MRMWMVDPKIMCQKHLCGEHVELHMFIGHLKKGKKIDGYLKNNCLEPESIWIRHFNIAYEMISRGYKHKSVINSSDCTCIACLPNNQRYHKVDSQKSLKELINRCKECKYRYFETLKGNGKII